MKSLLSIIFLVTSIISCIKILSTKTVASALLPFLTVIGIGLILDLIEEIKRYRNDLETNNSKTKIYKNKKFINKEWSNIKIGNLIKVKKDEIIPADLFVVCSSNKDGIFYLQTSNLDGETNLKEREVLMNIQRIFYKKKLKDENHLEKTFEGYNDQGKENCYIEVDQPNKNIYLINGKIIFNEKDKFYFDIKNTAIRGAILKNAKFIYGIVIYTGKETKIMQNFIKYKNKFAYLDALIDDIIIVIIIIRVFLIILLMLIGMYYRYKYIPNYEENKVGYEYIYYYRHIN
jgi:magnesium-transporting ATPase (P-type)